MPSKSKKGTNLSKSMGEEVPANVSGTKPKKKKAKSKSSTPQPPPSRSRPADDIEDNVSDVSDDPVDNYDLSPEDDIDDEPRFKYSTAELADSPRNTTCCIVTMCILCIIVAIALSVTAVKVAQKKDEERAEQAPAPTPPMPTSDTSTAGADLFTMTKEEVNLDCETRDQICSDTCSDFTCCDPMMNELAGCFFGNREGCLNYARCHIQTSGVEKPSPNINAICSTSSVANDPTLCDSSCNKVKCCWEDDSSCMDRSFYTCVDYAICQNLRGADLKVPLPIDGLEELCAETATGSLTQGGRCETACAAAECCWDPSVNNCLQNNFFTCLLYEPCGQLEIPQAFSVVPEPSVDTSVVCSSSYRAQYGPSECEASCNLASCCSASAGTTESCFFRDPLGCIKYDGCKLLSVE